MYNVKQENKKTTIPLNVRRKKKVRVDVKLSSDCQNNFSAPE